MLFDRFLLAVELHDQADKILIRESQKVHFRLFSDPFWDFILRAVLGIHDPRISWLPFGTKKYKMQGPPVFYKGNSL